LRRDKLIYLSEHAKIDTKHLWHITTGAEPNEEFDAGREHLVWRFANDYGASVSCNSFSHWAPELAVIKFTDATPDSFKLVYDTPVTNNVIGWIEAAKLPALFETIKKL
jgi:hypothetical protein